MKPPPVQEAATTEEQPAATGSRSELSQRPASRSVSVTTISSRETLASGTLWIVIPTSEVDSSEREMDVPASPSRLPGHQELPNYLLTEAVTTSVLHCQRVEDEAETSSSHGPERELSERQTLRERQDPRKAGCPEVEESAGSNPAGA